MLNQEFKLRPSRCYLTMMSIIFLLSFLIIFFLSVTIIFKLFLLGILVCYSGRMIWQVGLLLSDSSIVSISYQNEVWHLKTRKHMYTGKLLGDSTVTNIVSILRFRTPKQFFAKSCVVFFDSLDSEEYRRLILILKMGG